MRYLLVTTILGSQPITPRQAQQVQQIDQRLNNQKAIEEQNRQYQIAQAQQQKANNQKVCNDLEKYKLGIVAQQRQRSTDWLRGELKRVNDQLYDRKCETL